MLRVVSWVGFVVVVALVFLAAIRSQPSLPGSRASTTAARTSLSAGWGVDALLLGTGQGTALARWQPLLSQARLQYLRERNPAADDPQSWIDGPIAAMREHRAAGYETVVFAETPGLHPGHEWDALPEDLLQVYWASYHLARRLMGAVSVWELPNEPDSLFCRDLPDRLTAYSKAAYLGLRDGAAGRTGVLMSALGNSPGPWLERAAENGLYDYTDGLNIHFYGHARDFRDALRAQRAFADQWRPGLPVWVTEAGIDAVPHGDLGEARGREIQRDFVVETARVAKEEGVGVFMPFVLQWPDEPWFALTSGPGHPWPAWTAYANFTRQHGLAEREVLTPPRSPDRVVVQWLPDYTTCFPHKVSGSYWFRGSLGEERTIKGEVLVYNLSKWPRKGWIDWPKMSNLTLSTPSELPVTVAPFSVVRVPVVVRAGKKGYLYEKVPFTFRESATSRVSSAVVAFETQPTSQRLSEVYPISGFAPQDGQFNWIWSPQPWRDMVKGSAWVGLNGVIPDGGSSRFNTLAGSFQVRRSMGIDPRLPPMAVSRVDGLPSAENAFLRVRFPGEIGGDLRVDLVDVHGQRFAIAENFGVNRYHASSAIFLGYRDFQIYAWGRCSENPRFRPEDIREVQLRFYPSSPDARFDVALDVVSP